MRPDRAVSIPAGRFDWHGRFGHTGAAADWTGATINVRTHRIDSHVHIYQSTDDGVAAKEGYEIWEYGRQEEVAFCDVPGTVDDLLQSMDKAAMDKAVIVNLFVAAERRAFLRKDLPPGLGSSERERADRDIESRLRQELMAFNRWACDVARDHPAIFPFICADVLLLTGEETAAHVRDLAENEGARGVKLHGPAEGFFMGDERLWPTYTVCRELGLPVIGHSGPDPDGNGFAEPRAFGAALKAFPELPIVLAHMAARPGSRRWRLPKTTTTRTSTVARSSNGPEARTVPPTGSLRSSSGTSEPTAS